MRHATPSVRTTVTGVSTAAAATVPANQPTEVVPIEASPSVANSSEATGTPESTTQVSSTPETTVTATAVSESVQGTGAPQETELMGPSVLYNGIEFEVNNTIFPSITVQSAPINQLFESDSTDPANLSSILTGTLFVLKNDSDLSNNSNGSLTGEPGRILVVRVSELLKNPLGVAPGTQPITDTTNVANAMTETVKAPEVMIAKAGTVDLRSFITTLSALVESGSPMPTSAISQSLVLTHSWLSHTGDDRVMLFQTNGKLVKFQDGEGVRFVAAINSPNSALSSDSLYYVFHGLTTNRTHYVSAMIPIKSDVFVPTATSTLTPFPLDDADGQAMYLSEVSKLVDSSDVSINGAEFQANLQAFDAMLGSLKVSP